MKPVTFKFRNHRGEIQTRTIVADSLEFIPRPNMPWNIQPGWYISGVEEGKGRRTFALNDIVFDADTHRNSWFSIRFEE